MGRTLFTALVTIAFLYIASPLLFPIAMGAVLAVLFFPWLERAKARKIPASLASALLTLGITLVLILPTSLLMFFATKTAFSQLQVWNPTSSQGFLEVFLEKSGIHDLMVWVTSIVPINMAELADAFQELGGRLGGMLTELIGGMLTHLPGMFLSLAIVVLSVYFFLVDGPQLVEFLRVNSVFNRKQTDEMLKALAEMCRSVILASVVSGSCQAFLEIVGCIVTSTPHLALVGVSVFLASFFPVVGSAPVTFGFAIQQWLQGRQFAGIVLFMIAVVIVVLDNLIRPIILKGSTNLHPLVAFVAAFGGLQTLGFLGMFLGPIIAALFVVTLRIVTRKDALTVGT